MTGLEVFALIMGIAKGLIDVATELMRGNVTAAEAIQRAHDLHTQIPSDVARLDAEAAELAPRG